MFAIRRRFYLCFLLLALAVLLLLPFFLFNAENQGPLSSFLSPPYLERTLTYDEEGNLIHVETVRAIGDPAALESLRECAQAETLDPQIQQKRMEGVTGAIRSTKRCK